MLCFLKGMKILIHRNCVHYHVVYWTRQCDCVQHGLQMCTKVSQNVCIFYKATRREIFYCNKVFISRKLTGDEKSFYVSSLYQLNWNTNICIAKRGHNHQHRQLYFMPQHTHTHSYVFFLKFVLEFLRNFPSPLTEVAGRNFPMSRCCLIAKLHSLLFQTTVMNYLTS